MNKRPANWTHANTIISLAARNSEMSEPGNFRGQRRQGGIQMTPEDAFHGFMQASVDLIRRGIRGSGAARFILNLCTHRTGKTSEKDQRTSKESV